jgi:hypothetical protein
MAEEQARQRFPLLSKDVARSGRQLSEKTFAAATPSDKLYLNKHL